VSDRRPDAGTEQDQGGNDTMGDSAEFEKLVALEARLAAAFDRIANGMSSRGDSPGVALFDATARAEAAEAAAKEAEARADELAERVSALETRLAEAQEALSQAEETASDAANGEPGDTAALEQARAETADAVAARTALEARIRELEAAAETRTAPAEDADLAVMKRRVERARAERDAAIEARDAAQDLADELSEAGGATPDERVLALRAELRGLRATVDQVSSGLDELRSVAGGEGSDAINRVLEAQVAALTEARKAEAAELGRILSDLIAAEAVREEEARNA
jgi:chromosome segregation ATPase